MGTEKCKARASVPIQRFYSYFLAFKSFGTALHFVPDRQIIGLSFSFFSVFLSLLKILYPVKSNHSIFNRETAIIEKPQ